MEHEIGLTKWPALIVTGEKVTQEQAIEIIIRTQDFNFFTNDWHFLQEIEAVCGIPTDKYDAPIEELQNRWDRIEAVCEEYQCLKLEYLYNSQICSSYVGGPHGWCNWYGDIFTNSYNIGKWPSVEAVLNEWQQIATAFPFLKLTSQLCDGEHCEDSVKPVIQFEIKDGEVKVTEPTITIPAVSTNATEAMLGIYYNPFRERGCTVKQFQEALKITKRRLNEKISRKENS